MMSNSCSKRLVVGVAAALVAVTLSACWSQAESTRVAKQRFTRQQQTHSQRYRSGQTRMRLPRGRAYSQGVYYGNFNNRFYGPQYGYF